MKPQTLKYVLTVTSVIFILVIVRMYIKTKQIGPYFEGFSFENPRVVVSLTTSPKRIQTIETVIKAITTEQIVKPDVVYLHLPEKFERTGERYEIPVFLKKYEDTGILKINRVSKDEGPITKFAPTLRIETDPNTIIIICDDDTKYEPTFVHDLKEEFLKHNGQIVISNVCRNDLTKKPAPYCELPEGYSGVAFGRYMFKDDFDAYLEKTLTNEFCVRSDDLIIGNYLNMHNIPKTCIQNQPADLPFAKQSDALSVIDVDNNDRYTPCRTYLKEKGVYANA